MEDAEVSLLDLGEELTCSICLSLFDSPVTIPCGHNFCQECLLATWKDTYSCPQCRTLFATRPELKKNTVLSAVVETFRVRSGKTQVSPLEEKNEEEEVEEEEVEEEVRIIRCDTCMEAEAARTCLTCMASFCDEHLRPHLDNPNLSLHQLSEPVGDLMERICPDHHKLMDLYCSEHQRMICSLCLQISHKGCSFITPEEQRNLKESDLRTKLGLLDVKMEKTEAAMLQIHNMQIVLKDSGTIKKTALAAVYQEMRDILSKEEREAQHEVDRELEAGLTKHREFFKKFTENVELMRAAKDRINSLLTGSQTMAFLQTSYDLPRVVKFEPNAPRIHLDSKKVMATEAFAAALKEHLAELFKQPVEDRFPIVKTTQSAVEKTDPVSEAASPEPQPEPEQPRPPPPQRQRQPPRSHSPGRPPIQPHFGPVTGFTFMGPHPGWNQPRYPHGHPPGFFMQNPFHQGQRKQHRMPSNPRAHTPSEKSTKPNPQGQKPSEKSTKPNPQGQKPSEKSTKPNPRGQKPSEKSTKPNPQGQKPSEKSTKQHQQGKQKK